MIANLLSLLEDASAGAQVHASFDPDALLYVDHTVQRARDISANAYAERYQRSPGRSYRNPVRLLEANGVDWFRVETDRPVTLAAGYRNGRIAWLTLTDAVYPDWDFERGLRLTISRSAYAEAAGLATPRSWLDLAYHALYANEDVEFSALPGASWGCHSSGVCCEQRFDISVPQSAQAIIDLLPWELSEPVRGGTRLPRLPSGELELKRGDEVCRFLDGAKRCRIHAAMGFQPFATCARYPLQFAEVPGQVHVTAQFTCGSARENQGPGLLADPAMLRRMLSLRPRAVPAERDWVEILPLEQRVLTIFSEARDLDSALEQALAITGAPVSVASHNFEQLRLTLVLTPFLTQLGLSEGPIRPPNLAPHAQDSMLIGMIRNLIYAKKLTAAMGFTFALNTVILLVALVAHARARSEADALTTSQLRELAIWFMHDTFLRQILEKEGLGAYLRDRLSDAEFGHQTLFALRAAVPDA